MMNCYYVYFAGMLALLLDTELSSTQRDYAQTAQACGKALIALINEVLDRAKIEARKLELEAVPFDLRSILDDVLSLFSEKSRNKGIEVRLLASQSINYLFGGWCGCLTFCEGKKISPFHLIFLHYYISLL